jgi:hypothetical protein
MFITPSPPARAGPDRVVVQAPHSSHLARIGVAFVKRNRPIVVFSAERAYP